VNYHCWGEEEKKRERNSLLPRHRRKEKKKEEKASRSPVGNERETRNWILLSRIKRGRASKRGGKIAAKSKEGIDRKEGGTTVPRSDREKETLHSTGRRKKKEERVAPGEEESFLYLEGERLVKPAHPGGEEKDSNAAKPEKPLPEDVGEKEFEGGRRVSGE